MGLRWRRCMAHLRTRLEVSLRKHLPSASLRESQDTVRLVRVMAELQARSTFKIKYILFYPCVTRGPRRHNLAHAKRFVRIRWSIGTHLPGLALNLNFSNVELVASTSLSPAFCLVRPSLTHVPPSLPSRLPQRQHRPSPPPPSKSD
jgi:hypothetical protein